jgi:hypothetical protein
MNGRPSGRGGHCGEAEQAVEPTVIPRPPESFDTETRTMLVLQNKGLE